MAHSSGFVLAPPPPYEEGGQHRANREYGAAGDDLQETIPKTALAGPMKSTESVCQRATGSKPIETELERSSEAQKQHPTSENSDHQKRRKSAQSDANGLAQSQFIDSLSAPKRFLSHITVEPLAFMAILALYIEFPSIQDLIYTKICLHVITQHPNLTGVQQWPSSAAVHPVSGDFSRQGRANFPIKESHYIFDLTSYNGSKNSSFLTSGQLPDGGRIQQPPPSDLRITNVSALSNSHPNMANQFNEHTLCDRLNKTAIPKDIRQEIIDGDSLFWLKYQITICLLCFLSSPYWGGISDRIGRLIPLNVAVTTAALSNLISLTFGLLISLNSHTVIGIEWLYLGAVITGLSGGQAVVIVGSFSFISDNTSSESRSKRITILESVIFLSHSVGFYITKHIMSLGLDSPVGGLWFLNRHFVAFSLCAALNLICILYSFMRLRHHRYHRFLNNYEREQQEAFAGATQSSSIGRGHGGIPASCNKNLGSERGNHSETGLGTNRSRELTASSPDDLEGRMAQPSRKWRNWGVFLTFTYYKQTYLAATKRREARPIILLLLFCGFISAMTLACLMSLLYIYLRTDPINWTTSEYSSWNSIGAITQGVALVCLTLLMKFVKSWNVPDPLVSVVGYLSKGTGLLMIALAQTPTVVRWALVAFIFSEFSMPPIRSLLSKLVVREEVGKIYSCLAAMQSISFLFGNVVFYLAYTSLGLQTFFRLSFLVVAGFQFAAVILMLLIYTSLRRNAMIV